MCIHSVFVFFSFNFPFYSVAGTLTWVNGNKYVGEFKDGVKHGQGMSCARGRDSDALGFFFIVAFNESIIIF